MNFLRIALRYVCFNDVTKLCLTTGVGIGIVAGAGAFANFLVPGTSQIHHLGWISAFYLVLGLIEPLRGTRSPREAAEPNCNGLPAKPSPLPKPRRSLPLKPQRI